jgi:adenosylcobyric acid synthase
MVQGTASSAGKSLICTALCRIFSRDGFDVFPFKSQNMSLNSYVTKEGLEMGRAQVLQAYAAGKEPQAIMNPILLKPTTDRKSQVVVMGTAYKNMDGVSYFEFRKKLRIMISDIYKEIERSHDIVVIEGAVLLRLI